MDSTRRRVEFRTGCVILAALVILLSSACGVQNRDLQTLLKSGEPAALPVAESILLDPDVPWTQKRFVMDQVFRSVHAPKEDVFDLFFLIAHPFMNHAGGLRQAEQRLTTWGYYILNNQNAPWRSVTFDDYGSALLASSRDRLEGIDLYLIYLLLYRFTQHEENAEVFEEKEKYRASLRKIVSEGIAEGPSQLLVTLRDLPGDYHADALMDVAYLGGEEALPLLHEWFREDGVNWSGMDGRKIAYLATTGSPVACGILDEVFHRIPDMDGSDIHLPYVVTALRKTECISREELVEVLLGYAGNPETSRSLQQDALSLLKEYEAPGAEELSAAMEHFNRISGQVFDAETVLSALADPSLPFWLKEDIVESHFYSVPPLLQNLSLAYGTLASSPGGCAVLSRLLSGHARIVGSRVRIDYLAGSIRQGECLPPEELVDLLLSYMSFPWQDTVFQWEAAAYLARMGVPGSVEVEDRLRTRLLYRKKPITLQEMEDILRDSSSPWTLKFEILGEYFKSSRSPREILDTYLGMFVDLTRIDGELRTRWNKRLFGRTSSFIYATETRWSWEEALDCFLEKRSEYRQLLGEEDFAWLDQYFNAMIKRTKWRIEKFSS